MANLVFKFNWEHRPFPYNAAQGKQQFMLPFASGIPNLTPDWTQVQGVGTAATGTLTTSRADSITGRVLRVGDFGLGDSTPQVLSAPPLSVGEVTSLCRRVGGDNAAPHGLPAGTFAVSTFSTSPANAFAICYPMNVRHDMYVGNLTINSGSDSVQRYFKVLSAANTAVDGNGFIKAASPIVKLYANSIDLDNPLDIPAGRWIDVRLHEEPIPENLLNDLDELVSDTLVEFQPTNLALAVAAAMDGVEPPEIKEEQTNESL
jgi:hypothetical protein